MYAVFMQSFVRDTSETRKPAIRALFGTLRTINLVRVSLDNYPKHLKTIPGVSVLSNTVNTVIDFITTNVRV